MKNQKTVNEGANETVNNTSAQGNNGGRAIKIENKNDDSTAKKKKGFK